MLLSLFRKRRHDTLRNLIKSCQNLHYSNLKGVGEIIFPIFKEPEEPSHQSLSKFRIYNQELGQCIKGCQNLSKCTIKGLRKLKFVKIQICQNVQSKD